MEPISTVIVEDEEIARRGLAALLAMDPGFRVVATCADGRQALDRITTLAPDLVLLDIQMPEWNGFDVLDKLPEGRVPVVIFVTAYDTFAIRAFEAHALDYVLKPVSPERLGVALARAKARVREHKMAEYGQRLLATVAEVQRGGPNAPPARTFLERIMVKEAQGISFYEVAELDWIEGADYYVTLHAGPRSSLYRESLKHLEERLDPTVFLRIHTSAIVNMKRAVEIRRNFRGDYEVVLATGQRIKVSRRRKGDLLAFGIDRCGLRG